MRSCSTRSLRACQEMREFDVGCGTGAWLSRLRHAGYRHLHGIDLDETTASFMKSISRRSISNARTGNSTGAFDFIMAIEVIEHIGNRTNFLRNLHRHLGPEDWQC